MSILWLAFGALVLALVALDLYVLRPRTKGPTAPGAALGWGMMWLVLAMAFNTLIYFVYKHHWFDAGLARDGVVAMHGGQASLNFLISFILEVALNIDTVFIVAAVFHHFGTPAKKQHRVLMYGMLIALLVRAFTILTLGELLNKFEWVKFVLVIGLLVAAVRMTLIRTVEPDPEKNFLIRMITKYLPFGHAHSSVPAEAGILKVRTLTPLLLTVLTIELADVLLALDSIPASLAFNSFALSGETKAALRTDPFLVFAGSAFGLLCLRALFPALQAVIPRLRMFKIGLSIALAFAAVWIAFPSALKARLGEGSALIALAILGLSLSIGLFAAFAYGKQPMSSTSPLGEDADRFARQTLATARRVAILVVGVTLLLVGAIMVPAPGPGIPVLFIALLVLATEFVWARVLLKKYGKKAEDATMAAASVARKRFRPWNLIALMGLVVLGTVALIIYAKFPLGLVLGGAIPMLVGQCVLYYLAFVRAIPQPQLPAQATEANSENEAADRNDRPAA